MGSSFEYSYTRLASRLRRSARWKCLETGEMMKPLDPSNLLTFDCPTFVTPTFITSDIHHPLTEFRHSSPWTFVTPYPKADIHHLRHSSPIVVESDIHHPGHSSPQTFITLDIHHLRRSSPQTFISSDVHHLRHSSPPT